MNIYFWLYLFIAVLVVAAGTFAGGRNGFVKEAEGLVVTVLSVIALALVSSLARGGLQGRAGSKALAIALLIVLGAVYALLRALFSSLRLFAGFPVIHIVDSFLGLIAGAAKAFLLLYIVDLFLRIWLEL